MNGMLSVLAPLREILLEVRVIESVTKMLERK